MTGTYVGFVVPEWRALLLRADETGDVFEGSPAIVAGREALVVAITRDHANGQGWTLTLENDRYRLIEHGVGWFDRVNPVTGSIGFDADTFTLQERPPRPFPAKPLTTNGRLFLLDGQPTTIRGVTMFMLPARLARGEDLASQFAWLRSIRANTLRCFGRVPWGGEWAHWATPETDPQHWSFLRSFFTLVRDEGFHLEWTIFTGPGDLQAQRRIAAATYEVASEFGTVHLVEAGNEPAPMPGRNPIPVVDILDGIDRRGMLSSYGLYQEGMHGVPHLEYGSIHTARDDQWPRKARWAQEAMQDHAYPILNGEPIGLGEVNEPGRRTTDRAGYVRYAAISTIFGPGLHVHCQCGLEGRAPGDDEPVQRAAVEAIRDDVWLKIGPQWQTGQYSADHLAGSPLAPHPLWSYASILGNTALGVLVADEAVQANHGWRIVEAWGPHQSIARFERI